MRKRFYILFVARDAEGQLRKIPIPIHYLYVFLAGALIGMFTITGMAGSYTRMLWKVASFNQLRSEKNSLQTRYKQLEQVNHEKDIQVASLGSLANEVSVIYGLKPNAKLLNDSEGPMKPEQVTYSMDQLYALRSSALTGAATAGLGLGLTHQATLTDWVRRPPHPRCGRSWVRLRAPSASASTRSTVKARSTPASTSPATTGSRCWRLRTALSPYADFTTAMAA